MTKKPTLIFVMFNIQLINSSFKCPGSTKVNNHCTIYLNKLKGQGSIIDLNYQNMFNEIKMGITIRNAKLNCVPSKW